MTCRTVALAVRQLPGAAGSALAQGGTTSTIPGVDADTAGGVAPGADGLFVHAATGVPQPAVSNEQGASSFPGLNVGTHTVTVPLQGFKTFIANDVVRAGAPANVRAVLEIGGLEEPIVLSSSSGIA